MFEPAGVLPDSTRRPHRGWDGVLQFIGGQMEAFSEGWLEASEFIDRGDQLIVPYRFGGRARHTGLQVEFSFVHLIKFRNGKVTRLEVHKTKADAIEAAGLSEQVMSQENVEIVRRGLDAWNRRDWDEALKDAAADVEVDNSSITGEWRGVHRGPDEVKRLWEKFVEPWESVRIEIDEIIEADNHIVTRLAGHFVGREGIEVTTRTAWCYTFRDGQLTRVLISNELTDALEAAGLRE